MRHSLSTALPRIFNSVDLALQSSRRSCGSLTTFLFYHVRLHSSRFCGRFFPFLQFFFMPPGCCCFVPARFLPPRPFRPKNIRLDVVCVKDREKRKFLEIPSVSRRKRPHSRRNVLRFTPPCYIELSRQPLFSGSPHPCCDTSWKGRRRTALSGSNIRFYVYSRRYSQWSLIADSPCASWGMFRCFSARKRHLPLPALRHNGSQLSLSPVP